MKKVNVKVQMLATLFLPSGAFAFYRIQKANKGMAIYLITGILTLVSASISLTSYNTPYYWGGVLGLISKYSSDVVTHAILLLFTISCSILSILLPMFYIRK